MFPGITQYKTCSSEFVPFTKPVITANFKIDEKMVTSFTSRTLRKYIDLKPLRDVAFAAVIKDAIEEIAESYPDYNVFTSLAKAEIFTEGGQVPKNLTMFRLTTSRNDVDRKVFISIQLKFETSKNIAKIMEERIPILIPQTIEADTDE